MKSMTFKQKESTCCPSCKKYRELLVKLANEYAKSIDGNLESLQEILKEIDNKKAFRMHLTQKDNKIT